MFDLKVPAASVCPFNAAGIHKRKRLFKRSINKSTPEPHVNLLMLVYAVITAYDWLRVNFNLNPPSSSSSSGMMGQPLLGDFPPPPAAAAAVCQYGIEHNFSSNNMRISVRQSQPFRTSHRVSEKHESPSSVGRSLHHQRISSSFCAFHAAHLARKTDVAETATNRTEKSS